MFSTIDNMPYKYSQTTIKRLFALSNNICYFPNCPIKMIDDNKSIIGEICHIEGEKKGSARYNSRMSVKERNNFKNLILMCPNHHTFIDTNISQYPVDVLKDIKEHYENTNKEKLYNIPDDVLKILNVAVNYDEYSIERLYNFFQLYMN